MRLAPEWKCLSRMWPARADVHETRRTGHAVDHPIGFEYGAYLKTVFLSVTLLNTTSKFYS